MDRDTSEADPRLQPRGPAGAAPQDPTMPGPHIRELLDSAGGIVDFWKVEASAAERRISVRTGCFCNPGASETARGLTVLEMDRVFALGTKPSIEDRRSVLPGRALGAVRASVGIATTARDISRFVAFLQDQAADGR